MHAELGRAVCELRRRLEWSQQEMAARIDKVMGRASGVSTQQPVISRWENGIDAPSQVHRAALAKIAEKHGHEDLAGIFRAPLVAWQLVAKLRLDRRDRRS